MSDITPKADVYYKSTYWNDYDVIKGAINKRISGEESTDWMAYFRATHGGRRFHRALILNCGNGWVERDLFEHHHLFETCVGLDTSEAFLDEARKNAPSSGFTYIHHDINSDPLPDGPFDLVVNHAAAHHIAYLDHVFLGLHKILTADGVFLSYDYIGPHRNQYPYSDWDLIVEINDGLPEHLRSKLIYPHLPSVLKMDPTEAIHSELTIEVTKRYFDLLEFPLCQHTWDISPLEISVEGGGGSTHEYVGRERDLGGIGGSP